MNGTWEALTFSQNSESILKTGNGIFSWHVLCINRFMTLYKSKLVKSSRLAYTRFETKYINVRHLLREVVRDRKKLRYKQQCSCQEC